MIEYFSLLGKNIIIKISYYKTEDVLALVSSNLTHALRRRNKHLPLYKTYKTFL